MYSKPSFYWSDLAAAANRHWYQYKEYMQETNRIGSRSKNLTKRYAGILYWKALIGQAYRRLEEIDHLVNTKQIDTKRWLSLSQAGLRRLERRERKNDERLERLAFERATYGIRVEHSCKAPCLLELQEP